MSKAAVAERIRTGSVVRKRGATVSVLPDAEEIPDSVVSELLHEAEPLEVWTCTNPECGKVGGPILFGYRRVPVKSAPGGRKRVRQPQCRECRRKASRASRIKQRRSEAARRGWARRKERARRASRRSKKS